MKKLFAGFLLLSFTIAVCHAVPYSSGSSPQKTELCKKHFELPAFDMPVVIEVPEAPVVVYDLVIPEAFGKEKLVYPQSNSPPKERTALDSYSMAVRC
jgi:hypothetical protein